MRKARKRNFVTKQELVDYVKELAEYTGYKLKVVWIINRPRIFSSDDDGTERQFGPPGLTEEQLKMWIYEYIKIKKKARANMEAKREKDSKEESLKKTEIQEPEKEDEEDSKAGMES